jgi:copper(I)-binding protein
VDRFKLAACGLVGAVLLGGCSAGQVSQTAVQEAAVNGTSANIGQIAVRNAHLRVTQTADYVQPGREVELLFLASNGSPDVDDKLVSITSDIGTVALTGDTSLPANGALLVGAPDGQTAALESVEAAEAAKAMVQLTKPISNGLTYNFTFKFEKGGEGTVPVPISAGESPRREEVAEAGGSGGHSGGH